MGSERCETVRSLSTGGVGCLTGRKGKYERNTLPWPLVYRLFIALPGSHAIADKS